MLITEPKGEYSNLTLPTVLALIPKWVSVNSSYLSMSPEDNADILALRLSNLYWPSNSAFFFVVIR